MRYLLLFLLFLSFPALHAQKEISGKSGSQNMTFTPEFKRGLPPNLFVDLNFADNNGNGILEARESAKLKLTITNKGNGPAQGLKVVIADSKPDKELTIRDEKEIAYLPAGQSKNITIPLKAGFDIQSAEHKLEINVKEHFGYDMDPAYLVLNTMKFQEPELAFSGMEIVDAGEGTGAISVDGQLQAGELVKAKIVVQNIGQNVAPDTRYRVYRTNDNIYIDKGNGTLGDLAVGEVKEFWVNISPNKRVDIDGKLPVYLSLQEDYGKGDLTRYPLPVKLNQKPPEAEIVQVEADIDDIKKKVARFEYQSNKFSANVGNIKNIEQVAPSKTKRKHSVAVVFGVEDYNNLPPAPYAENDATLIKKYFKDRLGVEQVVTYTNEEAEGFIFDDVFNPGYGELQKAVLAGQTELFVFYSGHGLPSKNGKDVYLFPADGKVERLSQQGYNLDKFYKNLEKLEAKSVTVFLDACFSGASKATEKVETENLVSTKGVHIRPKYHQPWKYNDHFNVYTSSTGEQTSLGFDPSQTGLFTYYFCAGMQGEADLNNDRKITHGEMEQYLKENVQDMSKKIRGLQTPEFNGNENGVLLEY